MSLLRSQPVNPLNSAPAPEQAAFEQAPAQPMPEQPVYQQPFQTAGYAQPIPQQAVAPVQGFNPLATYAGASANDGFDDLDTGFGSFPRVKLDGNVFKIDSEKLGTEFIANLFQVRAVFVYRDRKATDGSAKVAYTYDHVLTTKGERLEMILNQWKSDGVLTPEIEERTEAAATILEGPHAGMVVMLSIPKQSSKKLAGYRDILKHTKGRRVPQVRTRVFVGDSISTGSTSFTPWAFEYAGDFVAQAA